MKSIVTAILILFAVSASAEEYEYPTNVPVAISVDKLVSGVPSIDHETGTYTVPVEAVFSMPAVADLIVIWRTEIRVTRDEVLALYAATNIEELTVGELRDGVRLLVIQKATAALTQ